MPNCTTIALNCRRKCNNAEQKLDFLQEGGDGLCGTTDSPSRRESRTALLCGGGLDRCGRPGLPLLQGGYNLCGEPLLLRRMGYLRWSIPRITVVAPFPGAAWPASSGAGRHPGCLAVEGYKLGQSGTSLCDRCRDCAGDGVGNTSQDSGTWSTVVL